MEDKSDLLIRNQRIKLYQSPRQDPSHNNSGINLDGLVAEVSKKKRKSLDNDDLKLLMAQKDLLPLDWRKGYILCLETKSTLGDIPFVRGFHWGGSAWIDFLLLASPKIKIGLEYRIALLS